MEQYKIGVLQLDTQGDKDDNFSRIEKLTAQLCLQGIKVLTMPEVFSVISSDKTLTVPEQIPGKTSRFLAELAKKNNIFVHGGSFREESGKGEKAYNTSLFINPKGEIISKYRKLHLFDVDIENGPSFMESDSYLPGDEIIIADTEMGCFGMSICYDLRFPEIYRLMALKGAQVIFVPANFTHPTGMVHWETLLKARAVENGCYIVAAGQTGVKPRQVSHGRSMVINPWGNIIAQAEFAECGFTAEIDLNMVDRIRSQIPSLKNRRTDVYRVEAL